MLEVGLQMRIDSAKAFDDRRAVRHGHTQAMYARLYGGSPHLCIRYRSNRFGRERPA